MTEPLCKDCKHYRRNWTTLWEPYCTRRVVTYSSAITGETTTKPELKSCYTERMIEIKDSAFDYWVTIAERETPEAFCGKIGRYWEAQE